MKNLLRRTGFGIVLWAVPYAAAVPMLAILHDAPLVFKALEVSIAVLTMSVLVVLYFRKIERGFLRESILVAATWMIVNWALDMVALLPFTHQSVPRYFMEIGIEYLASGAFVIATGYLLGLKLDAKRQ